MSVQTYQNIVKKLPDELVRLIHEYADPDITYIQTKIQNTKDQNLIDIHLNKHSQEEIETLMKYIPLCFTREKKGRQEKATLEAKHRIEDVIRYGISFQFKNEIYFMENDFDKLHSNVNREKLLLAFVLSGYTYTNKNVVDERSKQVVRRAIIDAYMINDLYFGDPGLTWKRHLIKFLEPLKFTNAEKKYLKNAYETGGCIAFDPYKALEIRNEYKQKY